MVELMSGNGFLTIIIPNQARNPYGQLTGSHHVVSLLTEGGVKTKGLADPWVWGSEIPPN